MLRVPTKSLWWRHRSVRWKNRAQVAFGKAAPAGENGPGNQNPP